MKLGIREKILIITVTTFLLAIGMNTLVISRMFRKGYSAALQSKMDVIANTLRSQMERLLGLGIAIDDVEGFEAQCQEILRKHKDVGYVMVTRMNGKILFHNDPIRHDTMINDPGILKALKHSRETACLSEVTGRPYYNTVVPVEDGSNEPSIAVVVGFPTELIDNKIQALRYYSFMAALVSLGLTTFLLLTILSVSVTKPLSRLVTTIQYIRDSSDLSKRVEIFSRDELGDLAHSFNQMTEDLQRTTTSINNLNREVTERKKAEQRQAQLLEQLEKANQELRDFAYIVSHDLKAPLRGIATLANWISTDYADKLDEQGREQINLLIGRAGRMHDLIDGILQYSKIGRIKEEKVVVNLNELVSEVIDMIAPPENITITVENELPTIECERTRITQVFQNLISNAVKYMDKPDGQIKISCVEEDRWWKFSISDNGPGIKEKYFEKIFQIFQTLSRRDEFESTGVGLSLVKKIVEMYDGKVRVESEPGEGSTFFFTLSKQETEVKNEELQANIVS